MRVLGALLILIVLSTPTETRAREVELSWDPMEGAIKYEIELSIEPKFEKPLMTVPLDRPAFSTQLGIGRYFYRVRAIDAKGKPGKWSKPAVVRVAPYAPELAEPATGFEASYFEIPPDLQFSWKPVESNPEYEILIYKTTGQKALEEKTKDALFKTNKITAGEYYWKVRSVVGKNLVSPYSEPRRFIIVRKDLKPPELITPEPDGLSAAYRAVDFTWTQDPATHYTDLYLEKISGKDGAKPFKKKFINISGSNYKADYEEPGKYRWWVRTKEATTTPGVVSPPQEFEVRNDVMTSGNYELEFSVSPVDDLYTINSARQTNGTLGLQQDSRNRSIFYGFLGGYYFFEEFGLFFSTRTGSQMIETIPAYAQETDVTLRARFGSKGFNQEFWLGYRAMDIVAVENAPSVMITDFTALGPMIGTRLTATVVDGWKAQVTAFYFKPMTSMEGTDGLVADIYGGTVGVKWNFMYQFWLGYRFSFEYITGTLTTVNQSPSYNSSWTMYRTEPFFFSLSFEH